MAHGRGATILGLALLASANGLRAQASATKSAPAPLPLQHAPRPTTKAITAADLMTRLYVFAADSMAGREAGTAGNVKATDYIAAEAKRLGLVPAGENGSYFQTLPLVELRQDTLGKLSTGGAPLVLGKDYYLLPGAPFLPLANEFRSAGTPVVYAGAWGDTAHLLPPASVVGKVVVFAPPIINGQPGFAFWTISGRNHYAGFAAAAWVTIDITPPPAIAFADKPVVLDGGPARAGLPAGLLLGNAAVERIFGKPLAQLQPGDTGAALVADLRRIREPIAYPARNVVAVLPGRDPQLKGEYVALGSHNDHAGIGQPTLHDSLAAFDRVMAPTGAEGGQPPVPTAEQWARINAVKDSLRRLWPERMDSVFNGADDNGTGSVAMLEIAEQLAAGTHPRRSVLFVWHTAEEKGLYGSRWFADHPTVARDSIVAALNIDMIGRGEGTGEAGVRGDVGIIGSNRLSTELGKLVALRAAREQLTLDYRFDAPGDPHQFYCRSDHYPYASYGIPAAFFFTGAHPDLHEVTDEPEYIDYPHMARLTNYIADVLVDVADLDHRPVVDGRKPASPDEPCRQ